MISIDVEHTCLLELLKASLFGLSPDIPVDVDWEKIFQAAKKQCIVPLLASEVPSDYRNEWLDISYRSKAFYIQMMFEQNSLIKLFQDIPFVILKGSAAAINYPNPALRTFGDIDIYISNEHFNTARNLLENHGYYLDKSDETEFVYVKNGVVIELHNRISGKYYNNIENILINGINNSVEYKIGSNSFPGLPTYVNGLSLLGHIMHHLKTYGIGLRQIVDWMLFVHNVLDDTSWSEYFRPLAQEAGLEKLAIVVTYMCKKWLGLPDDISWCNSADEVVADQLLVRILDDGNFGCDRALYENVRISIKNEGTFKHLQQYGIDNWPLAQKHVFLRPLAWLYQLCRYACIGIASLFTGKKIFRKRKKDMSLEDLWNNLE